MVVSQAQISAQKGAGGRHLSLLCSFVWQSTVRWLVIPVILMPLASSPALGRFGAPRARPKGEAKVPAKPSILNKGGWVERSMSSSGPRIGGEGVQRIRLL